MWRVSLLLCTSSPGTFLYGILQSSWRRNHIILPWWWHKQECPSWGVSRHCFFLNECWTLSLWMRWDFRIKNTYCLRVRGNNGCSATWSLLQVNIYTHTLTDSAIYRYFSEVYHFKNIVYRNYSRYKKMCMNKSVHCKTPGFLSSNKPEGHTHREFIYFLAASADAKPIK